MNFSLTKTKQRWWLYLWFWAVFLAALFVLGLYFNRVSDYAPGLFCDEAEIGLQAKRFLTGDTNVFINPFFYSHYEYSFGSFAVITTIPFVFLFGLSEFSVRISSLFFGVLTLLIWAIWLHKNDWPKMSVFWLSLTPLFFHVVHFGFGQAVSLFLMSIGFMSFGSAVSYSNNQKYRSSLLAASISGLFISLSSYGYGMFQLAAPLLVGCLWLGELFTHRLQLRKYLVIFVVTIATIIGSIPFIHQASTNPVFWERFQQKTQEVNVSPVSKPLLISFNTLKYFFPTYLWWSDEATQFDSLITRHGLTGLGVYPLLLLPLFVIAFFGLQYLTPLEKRIVLPIWFFWWLSPIGGILTTGFIDGPYSFALIPQLVCVPILAGAGWLILTRYLLHQRKPLQWLIKALAAIFLFISFLNLAKAQSSYLNLSADYWGWQYGMKEIAPYMANESLQYDTLFISEMFNRPDTLLEFYSPNQQICPNCWVGGISRYDATQRQLFILRVEELEIIVATLDTNRVNPDVKATFQLPNGKTEFVAVEFVTVDPPVKSKN